MSVLKPQKNRIFFNFQLTCFSAIVDFILRFCTSPSSETWTLNLFLIYCFLMLSSKRRVSNLAFQKSSSKPNWYFKSKKIHFKPKKAIFWVTLTGSILALIAEFPTWMIFCLLQGYIRYRKVASTSPSCSEALAGFFRLSMKGKFYVYLLWPFRKKLISIL